MSKETPNEEMLKTETNCIGGELYILRLYVTGILPNSARAIVNVKAICEQYLTNRYELEIIYVYQQPALSLSEDIIALPVLVNQFPLPEVRLIGDLSDTKKVLKALHLI